MTIADNYKRVLAEVRQKCAECNRDPKDVLLLAVSKTVGLDGVSEAILAGASDFGENRPDELVRKYEAFSDVRWHFIGNIQSRRIRDIVRCSYLVHSLYKSKHAQKISDAACQIGKVQDVLLEVNVSGEESKSGLSKDELPEMLSVCMNLPGIRVCGLMTMAPQGDLSAAKESFLGLKKLLEQCNISAEKAGYPCLTQLSMGMSEDWQCAIECDSTIVRIGRAIFST